MKVPGAATLARSKEDEDFARRLQQEYDQEVAEKEKRASFDCPLCFTTSSYNDSVELDCLHRFCRECFLNMLEVKIREKCVKDEELKCPMPNCDCVITVPQVEGVTKGTPLWERFLESRYELWRPDMGQDHYCMCPDPKCSARFLAPATMKEVKCPACRASFCAKCCQHHPKKTCEEHRKWLQENDSSERELQELIEREKWQRCPVCKAACARSQGCNYMSCSSERCRGCTHFCYICGVQLDHLQHVTHYPFGLFAAACSNVRPTDEALLNQGFLTIARNDFRAWAQQWM